MGSIISPVNLFWSPFFASLQLLRQITFGQPNYSCPKTSSQSKCVSRVTKSSVYVLSIYVFTYYLMHSDIHCITFFFNFQNMSEEFRSQCLKCPLYLSNECPRVNACRHENDSICAILWSLPILAYCYLLVFLYLRLLRLFTIQKLEDIRDNVYLVPPYRRNNTLTHSLVCSYSSFPVIGIRVSPMVQGQKEPQSTF